MWSVEKSEELKRHKRYCRSQNSVHRTELESLAEDGSAAQSNHFSGDTGIGSSSMPATERYSPVMLSAIL